MKSRLQPRRALPRRGLLTTALGLLALLTPCVGQAADAPLKVGVSPVFPPLIFKEGTRLAGVEVDFATSLAQALGRPVQFVEVPWEDQIASLQEGRTDIVMSGMSITRARLSQVAFANPYLRAGQMALVRREDQGLYMLGFPLSFPRPIGVRESTTGDFLVQQEWPKAKRKQYASAHDAAEALVRKKIDMFICDAPVVWWLAGNFESKGLATVPRLLSDEQLAWAMRRSDQDLLARVNETLKRWEEQGRSREILKRWLPGIQ